MPLTLHPAVRLALSFFAMGCLGCARLPAPDFNPPPPRLKVVTYNLNYGNPAVEASIDYLLREDADIVCLQEITRDFEPPLVARTEDLYRHRIVQPRRGVDGFAFLSKFPLENARIVEPSAGWFPGLWVEVFTPLGNLQILNVHLKPPLSDKGSASISALFESGGIHRDELEGFLRTASPDTPIIVAGDFNEETDGGGFQPLRVREFTNALALFDRDSKTWFWKVGAGYDLSRRYDHILFNKHLHCSGAATTRVGASDHMPVVAVFSRPGRTAAITAMREAPRI